MEGSDRFGCWLKEFTGDGGSNAEHRMICSSVVEERLWLCPRWSEVDNDLK